MTPNSLSAHLFGKDTAAVTDIESPPEQKEAAGPTRRTRVLRVGVIAAFAIGTPIVALAMTSLMSGWPVTLFTTDEYDSAPVPADFREPIARGALACTDLLPSGTHAPVLAARIDDLSGFDTSTLYPQVQAQTPPALTAAIGGGTVRSVGEATRLLAVQDCEAADRADVLVDSGRVDGDPVSVALSIIACGEESTRNAAPCPRAQQILDTAHGTYTHSVPSRLSPVP